MPSAPVSRKVIPPGELIEDCDFTQYNGQTNEDTFKYIEIELPNQIDLCNNKFKLLREFYNGPLWRPSSDVLTQAITAWDFSLHIIGFLWLSGAIYFNSMLGFNASLYIRGFISFYGSLIYMVHLQKMGW